MRLLRLLAALVGGALHRLGQALRSWAGVGTSGEDDRAPDENGPPEHWLRYVRERAPWLVTGKSRRAPVLQSRPAAVVTTAAPRPASAAARASAPATAPASGTASAAPAAARAPGPAETGPVQPPAPVPHPAPTIRTVSQPRLTAGRLRLVAREIEKRSSGDAPVTPLDSTSIVTSPMPEQRSSISKPQPESPPSPLRFAPVHSIVAPISAPISSEPPVRAASATPRSDESWPSLPPPAFRLDAGEVATHPPPVPRDESEAAPEPPAQVEADDVGSWADLPDKGFEAWQVQSIQSLLREQRHLARLLAEQEGAGSSWSTPHS